MNKQNIRALIVEDEPHMRDLIQKKISDLFSWMEIVDTAGDLDEAFNKIVSLEPDLIFLDIKLKNRTSFELLEKLPFLQSEVIFITAYNDFMLNAIRFSAIDYLLKPIDTEELIIAVEKAKKRISEKKENKRIKHLIENIKQPVNKQNRIGIPTSDGYEFIRINDIIRCEADRNYTLIFLDNDEKGKIMSSYNLKEFENLLSEMDFCRVHKSHLIHLTHVKRFSKTDGNTVTMMDDTIIPISRTKKDEFLMRIKTI